MTLLQVHHATCEWPGSGEHLHDERELSDERLEGGQLDDGDALSLAEEEAELVEALGRTGEGPLHTVKHDTEKGDALCRVFNFVGIDNQAAGRYDGLCSMERVLHARLILFRKMKSSR